MEKVDLRKPLNQISEDDEIYSKFILAAANLTVANIDIRDDEYSNSGMLNVKLNKTRSNNESVS